MRIIRITGFIVLPVIVMAVSIGFHRCTSTHGRDWVTWNGPFADGTTDEVNWDPQLITDNESIIWRSDIGKGHSMVAVKGDMVYVFGNKNSIENGDTTDFDIVSCLNSEDGSEIWSFKYKNKNDQFPGPCSSPVLNGKNVYILSRDGDLFCLDASNGELKWQHQIKEMGYPTPGFGFSCSPVIHENLLVLKVGETGIAFDKKTGEQLWAGDSTRYNSYSSVVMLNDTDNEKLLLLNGDSLCMLETETGKKLSSYPWNDIGSDPLVQQNTVFLSNMKSGSVMLDISKNPPVQIWKNDSAQSLFQGFVRCGDYVYGFAAKKQMMPLRCINLKNGTIEWEEDLDKWGSLICANGKLVIITGKGRLIVAGATPEKYTEISSNQIFEIEEGEFKRNTNCCWTKPVLSHGKIYVRTVKGEMACVDVGV